MLGVIALAAHSKFEEKIDVLDLIISVLRDHEETLSRTLENFDEINQGMSSFLEKLSLLDRILERLGGLKVKSVVKAMGINGPLAKIRCGDWETFRARSQGAMLVTFEVSGENVTVQSITDLFVFTYTDGIPELMSTIGESAARWIRRTMKNCEIDGDSSGLLPLSGDEDAYEVIVNPEAMRKWLSSELGIPEDKIVHGRVLC